MAFFATGSSQATATWNITTNSPGSPAATGTLKFTYDPQSVPPNTIGGTGTQNVGGDSTPFSWVFAGNVLTWQLTNQDPGVETKTTYMGTFDGVKTVNGSFCNYQINFTIGSFSAVYQGS